MVTVQLNFSWAYVYGLQGQLFPCNWSLHCQTAKCCLTRKGRRGCKTANYNRCHHTKTLCDLSTGVWVSDAKTPGTVIQNHSTPPRSYMVDLPQVIARYNRLHLIPYIHLHRIHVIGCLLHLSNRQKSQCQRRYLHHLLQHLHYHQQTPTQN